MDISEIRRANLLKLFSEFVAANCLTGAPLAGLDMAFSLKIQINNNYFSGMKTGARSIGNKLARQIESNSGKPKGWLDLMPEKLAHKSKDLQRFLESAELAYITSDANGRKRLVALVREASLPAEAKSKP